MIQVQSLGDRELIEGLSSNMARERRGHAEFLTYLGELDSRNLQLVEGHSSLFVYCIEELKLSEPTTGKRIQVARLARRFPVILEMIASQRLTITNAGLLAPYLTEENHKRLLEGAACKRKIDVQRLIVSEFPQPEEPEQIPTFAGECRPKPRPVLPQKKPAPVRPLSAKRSMFVFAGDQELLDLFESLRDRLRHKYPEGKLEDIVREAFKELKKKVDPAREPERKFSPKPAAKHTRSIPSQVRRLIWQRDRGECRYTSPSGKRCGSRRFLQMDHVVPWSLGGSSQDPSNLVLLCRAHNQLKGGAVSNVVAATPLPAP
jgi:hypothetical protein